jgi:hypothetical protein
MASFPRIAIGLLFLWPAAATADPVSCPIASPFTIAPSHITLTGNSGGGEGPGCFVSHGFEHLVLGIGTNPVPLPPIVPGTIQFGFAGIVHDLPGDDFAVQTFSFWGPLAGAARVEFWRDGELQSSINTTFAPNRLFTFNLSGVSADQIRLINTAPDPPGVNDLATMSFMDARVTNLTAPTPEPASVVLLTTGIAALYARKRRRVSDCHADGTLKHRTDSV